MTEKILNITDPMSNLGFANESIISEGQFGAVLARAGLGKTSVVVQLAIFAMNRGERVLHISLDEPIKKVNIWYQEAFNNLAEKNKLETPAVAWESILPNRFILTLQLDGFTVPRLEERLSDLTEQGIFSPDTIVIDGLPFEETSPETIQALKEFAEARGVRVWFTTLTHRHEEPAPDGLPIQLSGISDQFATAFQIIPENDMIKLKTLIGDNDKSKFLKVDTATMLVTG